MCECKCHKKLNPEQAGLIKASDAEVNSPGIQTFVLRPGQILRKVPVGNFVQPDGKADKSLAASRRQLAAWRVQKAAAGAFLKSLALQSVDNPDESATAADRKAVFQVLQSDLQALKAIHHRLYGFHLSWGDSPLVIQYGEKYINELTKFINSIMPEGE